MHPSNIIIRSRSTKSMLWLILMLSISFQNTFSHMDMDELKSVYYGLDIVKEPVVMDENIPLGAVHVTSKYGQQYQCSFPDHAMEERKKEEEEKLAVEIGVVEMLKPMATKDCLYKTKDWWSYEFCYDKHVRQYHMEDGEIRGNVIYLGYYESDFDWSNETSKFMCEENSEDYLARIDESQTCVYTITVMTSRICRHPFFKSPIQRKSVPITCNPLLTQDEYNQFQEEQLAHKRRLEILKKSQKKKISVKKDKILNFDDDLNAALEKEMSDSAKELLGGTLGEFFPPQNEKGTVSKEKFEEMFGKNEQLWQLYQKGLDIMKKHKGSTAEEAEKEQEKKEKKSTKEKDEDEEIISEFDSEIDEIKHRYHSSQNKLAGLRRKLAKEHNWENDIENAIKEAEQEFGLKVDRSLVAGLSDTLNKLVNKLQDTEAELNSMDEEINSLKPEDVRGRKTEVTSEKGAKESTDSSATPDVEDKDGLQESSVTAGDDGKEKKSLTEPSTGNKGDGDEKEKVKEVPADKENIEDKIEAPPMSGEPLKETNHGEQSTFPRPKDASEEQQASTNEDEKPELKVKVSLTGDEEVDNEMNKLPGHIKKMLEESIRKDFYRKNVKRGNERLGLDDDHSYTRDKTVHVIQQEDEEGRTNRYIFVLGFNNFDDESTELDRQNALEENYGFVYKGNKQERKEKILEAEPER